MKSRVGLAALLVGIGILGQTVAAQKTTPNPVAQALEKEIKRAFDLLKQKGDPAPYFISYAVRENESLDIEAAFGALRSS